MPHGDAKWLWAPNPFVLSNYSHVTAVSSIDAVDQANFTQKDLRYSETCRMRRLCEDDGARCWWRNHRIIPLVHVVCVKFIGICCTSSSDPTYTTRLRNTETKSQASVKYQVEGCISNFGNETVQCHRDHPYQNSTMSCFSAMGFIQLCTKTRNLAGPKKLLRGEKWCAYWKFL